MREGWPDSYEFLRPPVILRRIGRLLTRHLLYERTLPEKPAEPTQMPPERSDTFDLQHDVEDRRFHTHTPLERIAEEVSVWDKYPDPSEYGLGKEHYDDP